MNKSDIRKYYKKLRLELPSVTAAQKSKNICNKIKRTDVFKCAENVMIYLPFNGEVDVLPLGYECIKTNKKLYVPLVCGDTMKACRVYGFDFEKDYAKNKFGIYEPLNTCECVNADMLDLIIAPAVAADTQNTRLGYGGGYYDKFLCNANVCTFAVCYDFQIVKPPLYIPRGEFDIQMDYVFTNN